MRNKWWYIAGILIVIVIVGGVYGIVRHRRSGSAANERQAVFLTNGQVYFGHLKDANRPTMILTDVYYLAQNTTQLQSGASADKQVNIIKLGQELHAPEDVIYLNRNQVLFYENMKNDSKVNDAINKFISGQSQ